MRLDSQLSRMNSQMFSVGLSSEVSKAELVTQIPPDTEDDDITIEAATLEEFVHVRQGRQLCGSINLPAIMLRSSGLHQS